jgi:hypothetical protein
MQTLKTLGVLLVLALSFSLPMAQSSTTASGYFYFCPDDDGCFYAEWMSDPLQADAVITDFYLYVGTAPGKSNYYRSSLLSAYDYYCDSPDSLGTLKVLKACDDDDDDDCYCYDEDYGIDDGNPSDCSYYGYEEGVGLPTDGRDVFVRLWFRINGTWSNVNFVRPTFFDCDSIGTTNIFDLTTTCYSQGTSSNTFEWDTGPDFTQFMVFLGSSSAAIPNIGRSSVITTQPNSTASFTKVGGFPTSLGASVFVRIFHRASSSAPWTFTDFTLGDC